MIKWRKPVENYGVKSVLSQCGRFAVKKKDVNCYQALVAKGAIWRIAGEADNLDGAKKLIEDKNNEKQII